MSVNRKTLKDGTRIDSFVCGCIHRKHPDKKWEYDKCPLHKRADDLENNGMNIHDALGVSLIEQIRGG